MSSPEYGHLLTAACFLYGAVHFAFSQWLFGHAPRWPLFPWGGYPMSAFSRWLLFSLGTMLALKEIARGLFHLRPSLAVVSILLLFMVALFAAFLRDRRLARAKG